MENRNQAGGESNEGKQGLTKSKLLTPRDFGWKDYPLEKFSEDHAYELFEQTHLGARKVTRIIEEAKKVGIKDLVAEKYIKSIPKIILDNFEKLRYGGPESFNLVSQLKDRRDRISSSLEHLKISRIRFPVLKMGYETLRPLVEEGILAQGYILFFNHQIRGEGFHNFYRRNIGESGVITAHGSLLDLLELRNPETNYIKPQIEINSTEDVNLDKVVDQLKGYVSERWRK